MASIIIFWAAVSAVLFFLLGIFFKALASAAKAMGGLVVLLAAVIVVAGGILLVLYMIYGLTDEFLTKGFSEMVFEILVFFITLGIVGALLGGLGAIIFTIAVYAAAFVAGIIYIVLETAAGSCEAAYVGSLKTITKRLDQW